MEARPCFFTLSWLLCLPTSFAIVLSILLLFFFLFFFCQSQQHKSDPSLFPLLSQQVQSTSTVNPSCELTCTRAASCSGSCCRAPALARSPVASTACLLKRRWAPTPVWRTCRWWWVRRRSAPSSLTPGSSTPQWPSWRTPSRTAGTRTLRRASLLPPSANASTHSYSPRRPKRAVWFVESPQPTIAQVTNSILCSPLVVEQPKRHCRLSCISPLHRQRGSCHVRSTACQWHRQQWHGQCRWSSAGQCKERLPHDRTPNGSCERHEQHCHCKWLGVRSSRDEHVKPKQFSWVSTTSESSVHNQTTPFHPTTALITSLISTNYSGNFSHSLSLSSQPSCKQLVTLLFFSFTL